MIALGGTSPSFLQHVGGHETAEQDKVFGRRLFKGEGGGKRRGTKAPFTCFLHVQGKKKTYIVVQNDTILGLFFNEQCMKGRRFSQNASFHLKGKGGKNLCQSSNQSSICNLFNQVLNCNFDLTINAIASLPKIKQRP
jgi:hypothetical protein